MDRLFDYPLNEYQQLNYKVDLYYILFRYIWHGMLPISIFHAIHYDKLKAQRSIVKVIKIILI